jgi:hypothetical protein
MKKFIAISAYIKKTKISNKGLMMYLKLLEKKTKNKPNSKLAG